MAKISCKHCGGEMEVSTKPKHSQGLGFFLIIMGALSIFFIFGLPFGILLIGLGVYFCYANECIWLCRSCKIAIPRVDCD
jgi:hypothetical protein